MVGINAMTPFSGAVPPNPQHWALWPDTGLLIVQREAEIDEYRQAFYTVTLTAQQLGNVAKDIRRNSRKVPAECCCHGM